MFAISGYVALGARLTVTIGQLTALGQARGAAARCSALLEVPATTYGPAPDNGGPGTVGLAEVTVDRPGTASLHRIDVEIPAGQSVALVGRDGSAATLAALCGRLVDPDAGAVLLDGQDVRSLTAEALHHSVTYAFDRPALLGRTITDTLALRVEPLGAEAMVEAARAACADEFIRRLPSGYRTPVHQAPMSGGEMQRIGLARAFAHPGRVLVLDDATSSLDTVTEHRISVALAAATGRTRVVVARRASTAARVDRVLWLDGGRVRGDGTHRTLWADPDYLVGVPQRGTGSARWHDRSRRRGPGGGVRPCDRSRAPGGACFPWWPRHCALDPAPRQRPSGGPLWRPGRPC